MNFLIICLTLSSSFFSIYEKVPSWHNLINYLYDLNYILIDWKGIGSHSSRIPAEADMIFIPNFDNTSGQKIIKTRKEIFMSLMLIFGHIKLLQVLMKRFDIKIEELEKLEDQYFN